MLMFAPKEPVYFCQPCATPASIVTRAETEEKFSRLFKKAYGEPLHLYNKIALREMIKSKLRIEVIFVSNLY
jgi:hypothetical protein